MRSDAFWGRTSDILAAAYLRRRRRIPAALQAAYDRARKGPGAVVIWDGLPKRLKIIGKRYKVVVTTKVDEEDSDGESQQAAQTILLKDDPESSFEYVREVALHEAIHAVDHQMHLCLSEEHVEGLGTGILALLRENPAFVRWLMAKEPDV